MSQQALKYAVLWIVCFEIEKHVQQPTVETNANYRQYTVQTAHMSSDICINSCKITYY